MMWLIEGEKSLDITLWLNNTMKIINATELYI